MRVLSETQSRELEFYEQFSELNAPLEISFDSVCGTEARSENSYWHLADVVKRNFRSEDRKLLDFGCGRGESSLIFSKIGYEVFGFDLSPNNIAIAKRLACKYELTERKHFSVSVAEKLAYPSDYFDAIVGTDILHHVEINQALSECSRVLKKGGVAIFHEPVRVPVFDALRETRFGKWLVPKEVSFERHCTADERKLTVDDLKTIRRLGSNSSTEYFLLFSRLDRFIKKSNRKGASLLEIVDFYLFKLLLFSSALQG